MSSWRCRIGIRISVTSIVPIPKDSPPIELMRDSTMPPIARPPTKKDA